MTESLFSQSWYRGEIEMRHGRGRGKIDRLRLRIGTQCNRRSGTRAQAECLDQPIAAPVTIARHHHYIDRFVGPDFVLEKCFELKECHQRAVKRHNERLAPRQFDQKVNLRPFSIVTDVLEHPANYRVSFCFNLARFFV